MSSTPNNLPPIALVPLIAVVYESLLNNDGTFLSFPAWCQSR